MPTDERRRFEPWPVLVVVLLASMIGVSCSFYWIARQNPDPVVTEAPRPGLEG